MVVLFFALQLAAFSSRTFLVQLDNDFQTPENPCRNSKNVRFEHPCLRCKSHKAIAALAYFCLAFFSVQTSPKLFEVLHFLPFPHTSSLGCISELFKLRLADRNQFLHQICTLIWGHYMLHSLLSALRAFSLDSSFA